MSQNLSRWRSKKWPLKNMLTCVKMNVPRKLGAKYGANGIAALSPKIGQFCLHSQTDSACSFFGRSRPAT